MAANLFMVLILVGGAIGALRTKQEVFPDFELDVITITVPYPGASPAEVEQGIILATEEAVRGLDGTKRITSYARENSGTVNISLLLGTDGEKMLSDVKNAIDRITSYPEDIERPTISLLSGRRSVISIVLSGDLAPETLHRLAERVRGDIIDTEQVTLVEVEGVRPLEVSVEISRENLQSYALDLQSVARQIRAASIELPGGGIDTDTGEYLLRVADRRLRGADFAQIPIKGTAEGFTIPLGEIATINDGYADNKQESFFNAKPAARVVAYRVGDETPTSVATVVKEVANSLREEFPPSVRIDTLKDSSEILEGRIDLLIRNATTGLLLVLIILAIFLDLSLAGWVALGIPISFMGAFLIMAGAGISINMVTLFAFIVTLGMVVDDAIIIGENIQLQRQEGLPPLKAAIVGAQQMAKPVSFSILTTMAAFSPLFFVPGFMGKIFSFIPSIVVSVLLFSLLESFFILPAHLSHVSIKKTPPRLLRPLYRFNQAASHRLAHFTTHTYQRVLRQVIEYRYFAVACSLSLLILSLGTVASGIVSFNFFPKLPGNEITATARLPYGVPLERTKEVQQILEQSWRKTVEDLDAHDAVRGVFTTLGKTQSHRGQSETGSHVTTIEVNLTPSENRDLSTAELSEAWRLNTPPLPGLEALTFNSSTGPGAGAAVNVQLTHRDTGVLAAASEEVATALRTYPQLKNVEHTFSAGKPQLDFQLSPVASPMGLTSSSVARQLRGAFFGAEALREQRGRDELKVKVRLPESQRRSEKDLEQFPIRTPNGDWVPLSSIAQFGRGQAPTTIRRENGKRIVTVQAELASGTRSPREVLQSLRGELFPKLKQQYPKLEVEFTGSQRDQSESLQSLGPNYLIAMLLIFALLAIPFGSYLQPLIIMMAIPFGIVGAIAGHVLMGFNLSIISMFGVIALSGVVVNDSLVLIDATNQARARGLNSLEAIVWGGMRRFRPILLTSLTTFFGLAPMILETSVQARFLIPMAISLGFGILFATFIILLIIPSLYIIVEDVRSWLRPSGLPANPGAPNQTEA